MKTRLVISALIFCLFFVFPLSAASYRAENLGAGSMPLSLNDSGFVTYHAPDVIGGTGAGIWHGGTFSNFGADPLNTFPHAISSTGIVTGTVDWTGTAGYTSSAFRYSSGAMQFLNPLLSIGPNAAGNSVNSAGTVAGAVWSNPNQPHAAIWQGDNPNLLPALPSSLYSVANAANDSGVAVGYSQMADGRHATVWSGNGVTDLGLGNIMDINNLGAMVGRIQSSDGSGEGVMWDVNYGVHILGSDSADTMFSPAALNDNGQIVGNIEFGSFPGAYGFLWDRGVIINFDPEGDNYLTFATDVNDLGQIAGIMRFQGARDYATLLTPTANPEPSSIGLVVVALVLSALRRPRRALLVF